MSIDRIPPKDGDETIRFFMFLEQIDTFKVQIRGAKDRWQTVTGDADNMLVELQANQLGGLSNPQVAALHLIAALNEDGGVKPNERVQLTYWHPSRPAQINSRLISLYFDDAGQLKSMDAGKDTTMAGLAAGAAIPQGAAYGDNIPSE